MQTTTNYGLNMPEGTDIVNIQDFNNNSNIIDTKLKELNTSLSDLTYQTAGGTATAITLTMQTLVDGYSKTFIASANNSGAATTINGKPLYKPGTTIAPNLVAGKAYTVWYNSASGCFFIKASAEGDAIAANVLAGKKFSNDSDTGITGTMTNNGAVTITPGTTNKVIPAGYHNGSGYVAGDADLISANIKSGVNIFGVAGSSTVVDTADAVLDPAYLVQGYSGYDDGVKKAGTMVSRPYQQYAVGSWTDGAGNLALKIPTGAYITEGGFGTGYTAPTIADSNFIASNIVSGKSIFGLAGSASILRVVTGTVVPTSTYNSNTMIATYTFTLNVGFRPLGYTLKQLSPYEFEKNTFREGMIASPDITIGHAYYYSTNTANNNGFATFTDTGIVWTFTKDYAGSAVSNVTFNYYIYG